MKPTDIFGFKTTKGASSGTWGFNKGTGYNARSERLSTIWKDFKRGIIYTDSFWESGVEFKRTDGKDFAIGIIFNSNREFAVITCPANDVVQPYHERMPFILDDSSSEKWLQDGIVLQLNQDKIVLARAA